MTQDLATPRINSRARARNGVARAALMAIASTATLTSAAWAADSTSSAADALAAAGTEVVVTAQKRNEDIKTVPISITALSDASLQAQHVASFDDLSRIAPGVAFDSNATPGTTNISIRGVSSQAGAATVGLYVDGVSVTTKNFFYEGAIDPALPDLDHLEVLRGPQGTLYGDSSEGGTILYVARPPNMHKYGGDITLDTSHTDHGGQNYGGSFTVNLPLVDDVFAVRVSGSSKQESGWIDHYAQAFGPLDAVTGAGALLRKGVNSQREDTLHVTARITPGWGLTITPALYYQHQYASDSSAFYIDTPGLPLYGQDKLVPEPGFDDVTLGSLKVEKDFSAVKFTSITGLLSRQAIRQEDGTFFNSASFVALISAPPAGPLPTPSVPLQQAFNILSNLPSQVELDTHYRQFTQELRLESPDEGPGQKLRWVAGLYFAQQSVHNTDQQHIPGINSTFTSLFGTPMENTTVGDTFGAPGLALFPNDVDENDNRTYKETQYSAFGQIDYNPAPDWHIGIGGRVEYALEHFRSVEFGFYQIGNLGFIDVNNPASFAGPYKQSAQATSFTPKATISHDVSAEETVYVSAGEGFRLGGPTGPITYGPTSVCQSDFNLINQTSQPTKFGSDTLWTYELGSKGRYLDNRLTLNGSGFYTDWRNIQQQIYLPDCGYYFTENVGDARIYGGEIEAAFKITPELVLSVSASGQSATITRSVNPITVPVGSNLIDVPQETVSSSLKYDKMLGGGVFLSALIDYDYTGPSNGSYQRFTNTAALGSLVNLNFKNPSYGVLNANLTLTRSIFDLSVYAKNLLDDKTLIQTPEINTVYQGYTVHPRVIGVSLTAHF